MIYVIFKIYDKRNKISEYKIKILNENTILI